MEKPKSKPPKRRSRMSKGSRVLLTIVCVVVGIAAVLGATVFVLDRIGHGALTGDGADMRLHDDAEGIGAGRVRYKGQLYQYKNDATAQASARRARSLRFPMPMATAATRAASLPPMRCRSSFMICRSRPTPLFI